MTMRGGKTIKKTNIFFLMQEFILESIIMDIINSAVVCAFLSRKIQFLE